MHFCGEELALIISALSAGSVGAKIVGGKVANKLARWNRRPSSGPTETNASEAPCKCPDKGQ